MRRCRRCGALALAAAAFGTTCAAQDLDEVERPLWEVGLGLGGITVPHYRGSDQRASLLFPVPYFIYRGEHLRADRNGVRGKLFDSDRVELNVSLGLSLPVESGDDEARRGMPDLKTAVEIGPSLNLTLWHSDSDRTRLDLRLPVRLALTVESSPRSIGWIFSPNLHLDIADLGGFAGWNLGVTAGPLFATARYNQYFYAVEAQFATATRPAYAAHGGYAGSMAMATLSRRFRHVWLGAFMRYDRLDGATFEDSPLVRRKDAFAAGVALTWIFGESATRVPSRE
ncbi:MipA/OmpV family protein [Cupriavidus sp. IK-TO18]|uniref:MipA/OmpV family protein n=1 Tax=Cupriavidus sp. IK-TO18 TaxID=2782182 RepID=UPI001899ADD7|nr:MipA/OmpV family protein [Cupriavidus sp. IK-TO18]MBF6991476.1 MipA/OmpV family protein [Cupriavidus sp. IK-TO18]